MYQIKLLPRAKNDLKRVKKFIEKDNKYTAIAFIEKLLQTFKKQISSFPNSGIKCKNYNYFIYKRYLIFYDIVADENEIVIMHITHSAQYTSYKNFL